ncbi:MAG: FAD-dependent oxidoreductase, partial [Bacteroidales bacterium]|nr:FAD-dependent oxidoreductase [Bacteroidales bacterium]
TACRRKMIDQTIAIVNIKSYSSKNYNLKEYISKIDKASSGKKIAIIGGGISGLTASFFLAQHGNKVVIFEKTDILGGEILNTLNGDSEAKKIFEQEMNSVLALGVEIKYNSFIDENLISTSLSNDFDSILISCSGFEALKNTISAQSHILIEGDSLLLNNIPLFKIGKAAKRNKQIIRDISQAKKAALAIDFFLKSGKLRSVTKLFNSVIGKIEEHEKKTWLKETPEDSQRFKEPSSIEESIKEAENCMHCDCRAQNDCQLRNISEVYKLSNPKRKMYSHPIEKKINFESGLIFENAKCIKCGLCVRLLQKETGTSILGFQGRGFMSIISEPLTHSFNEILNDKVDMLVDICPTTALSKRENL